MAAPVIPLPVIDPKCPVCGQPTTWQVGDQQSCQDHVGDVLASIYAAGPVFVPPLALPLEIEP